jgi:hypothetical protein
VDRKTAQHDVPVTRVLQPPVLAKCGVVAKPRRNISELIFLGVVRLEAQHFLQGDDVGVDLLENFDNTVRSNQAVQAAAFVHIICSHPDQGACVVDVAGHPQALACDCTTFLS